MYGTANRSLLWLVFYKPVYDYMQGRISFWRMARSVVVRWTVLGLVCCGLFYLVIKPDLDKQDRNMPAMVTVKQWDEMKALKSAGRPVVRPAGPNDAQWDDILKHLAAAPGPAIVLAPFERPQGIRHKLMDAAML